MAEPSVPDRASRDWLLEVTAELVARGGAERLLRAPVVPGVAAFPDAWAPTRRGVERLLRRLCWHADIDREVELEDRRAEAPPPTETKPATRVEVFELRARQARFILGFVGDDDITGTLAHEVGVVFAAAHRPRDGEPYRSAEPPTVSIDPDLDLERGSVATVYLGLGVLAANAAFQEYSRAGRFNGAYEPLQYDVLRAGHVPMSSLAFLVAVQAVVRGDDGPPPGLAPPQRDEVGGWFAELRARRAELRARLGIPADACASERPPVEAWPPVELADADRPARTAFRWRSHRGGAGALAGSALGLALALSVTSRGAAPALMVGAAACGHVLGRRARVARCSACAATIPLDATSCRACGATLRGDIARLADRLEAEEQLENHSE